MSSGEQSLGQVYLMVSTLAIMNLLYESSEIRAVLSHRLYVYLPRDFPKDLWSYS